MPSLQILNMHTWYALIAHAKQIWHQNFALKNCFTDGIDGRINT